MRRNLGQVLSAVFLGLPSALAAHALIFGNAHVIGANAHWMLGPLALLSLLGLLGILAANLHSSTPCGRRCISERLHALVPSAMLAMLATLAWFSAVEAVEPRHAIPALAALVVLGVALLVQQLLRRAATILVEVVAAFVGARATASSQANLSRLFPYRLLEHAALFVTRRTPRAPPFPA